MSLFSSLLGLHGSQRPEEDFFTEIVAGLLRREPHIAVRWLSSLGIVPAHVDYRVQVDTQTTYAPLEDHRTESRPDLRLHLTDPGGREHVLFVESKVGSRGSMDQLSRYAEILATRPAHERTLVFITRDYDPFEGDCVVQRCRTHVAFKQTRWHHFYHILSAYRDDPLADEAATFMERTGMARRDTFTPTDVLALQGFPQALSIAKESLWNTVSDEFTKVLGKQPRKRSSHSQLALKNRYILKVEMQGRKEWWFGLGFFLGGAGQDYPEVGGMLEVAPSASRRDDILEVMRTLDGAGDWRGFRLREHGAWSGIKMVKPLSAFLDGDNHVGALEDYLLSVVQAVGALKAQYPALPWIAVEGADEEGDAE
ncbi:hypothetical protein [Gaopeijia maritima]|uniref:hypothetical protein n=1 Tax=Gaopeijia maritima TaxID=3119007 RepID=UPI0032813CC4